MAIYQLYKLKESTKPIQIKDISKSTNIPHTYLEQIFMELKKADLIYSTRGPRGGYSISSGSKEILIKDIIIVLDGEISTIKGEATDPMFNLFFNDCNKQLIEIFKKPLSYLDKYELMLENQINYSI